jgi:hypothetical protein
LFKIKNTKTNQEEYTNGEKEIIYGFLLLKIKKEKIIKSKTKTSKLTLDSNKAKAAGTRAEKMNKTYLRHN